MILLDRELNHSIYQQGQPRKQGKRKVRSEHATECGITRTFDKEMTTQEQKKKKSPGQS